MAMVRHLLPKLDRNSLRLSNRAFSRFVPALLFGFVSLTCAAQQSALDLDGKSVDPLKVNTGRLVVLVFVREDCPISARYAPVIQRISDEHQKDARFYLVFPDKSESPADVRRYLHEFRYSIPGLRDPDHALVKEADAKVTPETCKRSGDKADIGIGILEAAKMRHIVFERGQCVESEGKPRTSRNVID